MKTFHALLLVLCVCTASALHSTSSPLVQSRLAQAPKQWGNSLTSTTAGHTNLQLRGGKPIGPLGLKEHYVLQMAIGSFYSIFLTFFPEAFIKQTYHQESPSEYHKAAIRWVGLSMLNLAIFFMYMNKQGSGLELIYLKLSLLNAISYGALYTQEYMSGVTKSKDGFYVSGVIILMLAYQIFG